jgi:hypothetical protein
MNLKLVERVVNSLPHRFFFSPEEVEPLRSEEPEETEEKEGIDR